ncbi:MntP/YtaF family protein [Paenibacillus sp. GCM10012307]|uniref:MntP/YtaF family protein n=1 Tax=Paenibacillus roseus TaxID=2798579 RepID=A0A934MMV5_9BACL|nr:MntP/YtaF family protein [Paenibacillus roseus]MBJ6363775.1 MntP/YtaF family protein [Paenibacillus roseus]
MLLHVFTLLLLAFAVSLDGFGVGVTYGLRQIRIPVLSILIIASCSGVIILLSMLFGQWMAGYISPHIAGLIGALILIGIGVLSLFQFFRNKRSESLEEAGSASAAQARVQGHGDVWTAAVNEDASPATAAVIKNATVLQLELRRLGLVIQILRSPQAADVDRSGIISPSEAILLGCALSFDAFGAGLGAALLGFPPLLTALLIAFSSGMFLYLGIRIGFKFSYSSRMKALSFLPGVMLIVMGCFKLL